MEVRRLVSYVVQISSDGNVWYDYSYFNDYHEALNKMRRMIDGHYEKLEDIRVIERSIIDNVVPFGE